MNEKLPNMCSIAATYKDAVCNSADAERSNSLYNILTERRRSLKETSIQALLFLYYNNGLL